MFWRTVGRLILVPLAFLIAAAAALFVLVTLGQERLTQEFHTQGPEAFEYWYSLADKAIALLAGVTIVPAIAVVIVGEVARIKSWLYYLIGGGIALGVMPLLAYFAQGGGAAQVPATLMQVFATAGFAGGFVYWLIAGRNA